MISDILLKTTSHYIRVNVPLVGDPDNLPDVLGEIVDSPRLHWTTFFYQHGEVWGSMLLGDEVLLYGEACGLIAVHVVVRSNKHTKV